MVIPKLNLANLDGENGFIIPGSGSYSNGTVSTGDLNGDDLSDLIISTADSDEVRGKVYVVFGTEAGFDASFDLTSLDGNNGFTIAGIDEYNRLGEALASGGDFNGDGFDDLVIGAVSAGKTFSENDAEYSEEQGEVYVIFGTEAGFDASFDLTSLDGNNGFTIPGINKNDRLGNAIDLTGDINGDGFDDLVVSGESNGKAYVIFGTEAGFDASLDLTSLDGDNGFTIPGINGMYALSSSSSHAGDLNGDGLSDLAISSFADEKIHVIFGTEAGFDADFDLTSLNGENGFTIATSNQEDRLGDAVSNAGDLNGDGLSDLIIGAPWSGETTDEYYGLGRGKAYIIFGTEAGFDADFDLTSLDGENGFAIAGIDIDDNLGDAVSNAGDLDGDGFDDLIISAPSAEESIKLGSEQSDSQSQLGVAEGYSDRQIQGEVYVIFGTETGFDANFDLTSLNGENGLTITSVDESGSFESGFAKAINSAGDLDGDGFDDLIISSLGDGANAGYVVFGSPELNQIRTIEELPSLTNPIVTVLDDENDGDLSVEDISLREAILYSNDGDTISFDASLSDGTILLSLGQLNIDKSLTIEGFADSKLTIDGNNNSRVFNIDDNFNQIVDVTIANLTITGGNAGDQHGGGIRNEENLTINDSKITGNSARLGGGIYNYFFNAYEYSSATTINNTVINNNFAESGGGAIYNGQGDSNSTLHLKASTVTGNSTDASGGGINNSSGHIKISNSTINQNSALYSGGGIDSDGTIKIVNSTISSNRADSGGGFNTGGFDGGNATIINSTISGNTATTEGGGISLSSQYGTNNIVNSTVTGNSAAIGAGIQTNDYGRIAVTVTSSIIAGNTDDRDVNGKSIISEGNNLIGNGDGASAFINRFNGDIVGTADDPIDPQLGELQDNGGDTLTHALLPESIAINTGSNPKELTTDQRGAGFERVLFDAPDIGAVEADTDSIYEPIVPPEPMERTVTTLDDEDDGDLSADDISLREAILISNPGDTIVFDSSLSGGTITLALGELAVDKSLTIRGLGADNLTIDADNNSRVFNVDDGSNTKMDVTIAKLTITGGNAAEQGGGGISNQENLIVNEAIITNNSADSGIGGGVLTKDNATTTINYSTISDNSTGSGGGIFNSSSTTTINYSTISGNSATQSGGGVASTGFYGGSTIVNNSTISGNSANKYGGGIDAFDTFLEVTNSTIADNAAKDSGSGVSVAFSGSTFTSNIIADNANNDDIAGDGNISSGGNNLIGNGDGTIFVNGIKQDLVGTAASPLDPKLEELQDNGGLTQTRALLPDSPAINAGSNTAEFTTDQRGAGFERVLFDAPDIGAFEADTDSVYDPKVLPADPIVTILEDEDDGDLSAGDISLREAILYSDAGDTISFDSSLSGGTIALTLGQLIIEKDLTINGLGADNLTIDANQNSRVLKIDDTTDDSINVTLDGLTITGGSAADYYSRSDAYGQFGGGIFNQENLRITNSIIANNVSNSGGGIYNRGIIEIDSSTIADNSVKSDPLSNADGGGISNYNQANDGSVSLKISNSNISGNLASGDGGGIANGGGYSDQLSQAVILNSTISGNKAQGNGGGIQSIYHNTQIQNSTISNNSASSLGSGVYHGQEYSSNINASTTLSSTIVAGNAGDRDIDGSLVSSDGHNLIGNGDQTDFADGFNGDIVGTKDNPLDPRLGELKDNGGLTRTQALLPDSLAINTGSNPAELSTDQRGLERSVKQTDIGAYEVQPTPPGLADFTIINGDLDDDTLIGTAKRDILNGNAGNDTLNAGEQFDRLNGGEGDDTLIGGGGIDVLVGDEGQDLFYLEDIEGSLDWIRDFELGTDTIGLADGITYDELEITGRVNSFINYQGNEIAVVLGVNPSELISDHFIEV